MSAMDPTKSMPEWLFPSHWGICAGGGRRKDIFSRSIWTHSAMWCPQPAALSYSHGLQFPRLITDLLSTKAHLFPWKWRRGTTRQSPSCSWTKHKASNVCENLAKNINVWDLERQNPTSLFRRALSFGSVRFWDSCSAEIEGNTTAQLQPISCQWGFSPWQSRTDTTTKKTMQYIKNTPKVSGIQGKRSRHSN